MKTRTSGGLIGLGLFTLAVFGGISANGANGTWAIARQPQTPRPSAAPAAAADHDKMEDGDDEVIIKLADAPEGVRAALTKITSADKVTKVIKEEDDGITTFEVEFTDAGMESSVVFSGTGEVLEIEKGIKEGSLPAAVLSAIKKEYPAGAFSGHTMVQTFHYEIEVTVNGKKHEIKVNAAGKIDDEDGGYENQNANDDEKDDKDEDVEPKGR